ncbi:MAG: M50 family metallopeptidase [Eubacteriales bacterium]|nr:M50 family metallopeptidase [Eubacteriales bacterium]
MTKLIYIIIAIVIFGLLIAIHELGHFLVAKACGVKVLEFSIGMGPQLWHKEGKETQYSLRMFPIGGFCAMEGEDGESDDPRAFGNTAGWKKFLVLIAGSASNFIAGMLLILCLFAASTGYVSTTLSGFVDGFPCQGETMLQAGDEIVSIDGSAVLLYSDISTLLNRGNGKTHDIVVRRDGEKITLNDLPLTPREYEVEGKKVTMYGLYFQSKEATFGSKLRLGLANSVDFVRMIWWSLEDLFTGAVGFSALSGPIGIVDAMGQMAESADGVRQAVDNLLYFAAFLAINLAFMNLLPLPALDGGRVFFLILNGLAVLLFRRRIPAKYEGYVHFGGLVLLLGLMVVVAVQDVYRIIG